ncbi:hypothetical protein M758_UG151900 [Ceratodon purpureus]|nr:hypothetical protein M758_UG151900 [Ceratodon purpureus]
MNKHVHPNQLNLKCMTEDQNTSETTLFTSDTLKLVSEPPALLSSLVFFSRMPSDDDLSNLSHHCSLLPPCRYNGPS